MPGTPSLTEFERLARSAHYTDLGVILLVSEDAVAVSFSHRFGDGGPALAALRMILAGRIVSPPRVTRSPVLRSLVATRQLNLAGLRAGRAYLRDYNPVLARAPRADPGREATADTVVLSDFSIPVREVSALAAAERARDPAAASVSTTAVLTALALRAVRRCLAPDIDLPVGMIVGLRRHLPEGLDTNGNFLLSACVGTLRERVWTAAEVRDRALPRIADRAAVAAYAVEALAHVRQRVQAVGRRRAASSGHPLQFDLSIVTGGIGVAGEDYLPGRPASPGLLLLHRGPAIGPHCTITVTGKDYIVTTVDDSASLDLTKLEEAFRQELSTPAAP